VSLRSNRRAVGAIAPRDGPCHRESASVCLTYATPDKNPPANCTAEEGRPLNQTVCGLTGRLAFAGTRLPWPANQTVYRETGGFAGGGLPPVRAPSQKRCPVALSPVPKRDSVAREMKWGPLRSLAFRLPRRGYAHPDFFEGSVTTESQEAPSRRRRARHPVSGEASRALQDRRTIRLGRTREHQQQRCAIYHRTGLTSGRAGGTVDRLAGAVAGDGASKAGG